MKRPAQSAGFLSDNELTRIEAKIAAAEVMTSAEIKIVIAEKRGKSIEKTAARFFNRYRLHKTTERNCVLILIVISRREYFVYGDRGIHARVGPAFWEEMRDRMQVLFAEDKIGDGICLAIHMAADRLAHYFPYHANDANEISNKVEFET